MTKTLAAVVVAFALGAPLAAHNAPAGESTGDSLLISVEIPARTGAPTPPPTTAPTATPSPTVVPTSSASPAPTSTANPAPAGPGSDAANPRPGALPATGGEIAVGAAVLALLALVAGLVIRARRRRSV
ncbi:LPXTG cell wall anchor domain-containing protein [Microbacterium sp. lyk4-40-TSB-66]|uniref:LPXTG cell wall anchor domain-containing protein n=1 Tax=Microbacterium sp. lyk4-40-TSB-66 TaxID=3040294 RepID=UPI00254C9631|nr:LPXTG cell wall anchor domain-containing protein [Microbacterium sp. lyk4-40-TSB-66]